MIFTKEQLDRLPGSTVRLRSRTICTVGERKQTLDGHTIFHCDRDCLGAWGEPVCFAETYECHPSTSDIVEVLQWADEKAEGRELPDIPSNGPLEVGMVFEGRAVESDGGPDCFDGRPITWETPLDKTGQANLPGEQILGRYGRSFRTEIRITEELTDPEEYAKFLEKKRARKQKQAAREMRRAARLGLPNSSSEQDLPF